MKVREGERGWGCGEDEVHCVAGFLSEMLTACAQEHGNKVHEPAVHGLPIEQEAAARSLSFCLRCTASSCVV